MAESTWERWTKIGVQSLGILTFVATIVGGTIAYFTQWEKELYQRGIQARAIDRESRKTFLDKQAALYFEVVPLASRLAVYGDRAPAKDTARFWELYWGELGMVEDRNVEAAMVLYGKFLASMTDPACAGQLQPASLLLSHCVRRSLFEAWGIENSGDPATPSPNDRCTPTEMEQLRKSAQQCAVPNTPTIE